MAEKQSRRKPDIMFLNIVFCLLVIFIHTASEVVTRMPRDTAFFKTVFLAQRLSYFVVPGFIVLSGAKLFIKNGDNIDYKSYYASRFLRIVLPYAFWAAVYYLYFCLKDGRAFDLQRLLRGILTGDIWAHFYFVVILIQFVILTPVWRWLYKRGNPSVHTAFSLMVTVISAMYLSAVLASAFPYMPSVDFSNSFLSYQLYWTAGCLIGRNYSNFQSYLRHNKIMISAGFIICGVIEGYLSLLTYRAEPVWLELFHMMYAMSAILFFYMIAQLFTGKGEKLLAPMKAVDSSSYMIYLVHCLVIVIVDEWMTSRGILDLTSRFAFRAAAVYIISISACLIWRLVRGVISKALKKTE